jgi:hypothetical protein
MCGIFPPQGANFRKETISLGKTLKTFFPHQPVERNIGSEQDF